ncbi:MAG: hypothetical protein R3F31_22470 [Verrucomicrobiales bacterium]
MANRSGLRCSIIRGIPRHPTWWHARTYGLCAANSWGQHSFEGKPDVNLSSKPFLVVKA